jgi:hypothetical protein
VETSILEIIGDDLSFKLAKENVLDGIEAKIEDQFKNENLKRCIRNRLIGKGEHEVRSVERNEEDSKQSRL